jgi:hypothetical protein
MPKMNDWKPETKSLLEILQKHGLTIAHLNNGCDEDIDFDSVSLEEFIDECYACEESRLYVTNNEGKLLGLYLVYGNDPGELVADYHVDPRIDSAVDEHFNLWMDKPQPMK